MYCRASSRQSRCSISIAPVDVAVRTVQGVEKAVMAVLLLAGFVPRLVENRIRKFLPNVNIKIVEFFFFFIQQKSPLTGPC